jgi:hypothetical protein
MEGDPTSHPAGAFRSLRGVAPAIDPEPRHDAAWYDQRAEPVALEPGDRLFIPCEGGGPSWSRLETFPPRLELAEDGGTYVLVDDGPRDTWRYQWVPHGPGRGSS